MDNEHGSHHSKLRILPAEVGKVGRQIVDACYKVHSTLCPGLLESVYEACLVHELKTRGLQVEKQVELPLIYDKIRLEKALRLDLVVENQVVIELKAVEMLLPIHKQQLLTYLKLSGFNLGYLVNFNVALIKDGISRIIN